MSTMTKRATHLPVCIRWTDAMPGENIDDMPRGIYIYNGKKVVK